MGAGGQNEPTLATPIRVIVEGGMGRMNRMGGVDETGGSGRMVLAGRGCGPLALAVGLLLAALLAAGCAAPAAGRAGPAGGAPVNLDEVAGAAGVRGVRLAEPLTLGEITMTDTGGRPYALPERVAGKLVLLFFGFTDCPDVCPTTMADLAAAGAQLPPGQRERVAVVFVTVDPERDTPAVLGRWLGQFDSSFVGLTAPRDAVAGYAERIGVRLDPPQVRPDGTVSVAHGAQVTAFGPDGTARVAYTAGTTVADYVHDIPLLLRGEH
jgi:protein SCO1/2